MDLEQIPLAPTPAAPFGRRRAQKGEYKKEALKTDPFFRIIGTKNSTILKISIIIFQETIICQGTQVTTPTPGISGFASSLVTSSMDPVSRWT